MLSYRKKSPRRKPRAGAVRKQPERALHAHVYRALCYLKPACVFFPVPNGAADLGRLGAILKAQGKVKAGVSDFVFLWGAPHYAPGPCEWSTCGVIELKAGRGKLNEDQEKFFLDCDKHRVNHAIARSIDEVVEILVMWGRLPTDAITRIRGVAVL